MKKNLCVSFLCMMLGVTLLAGCGGKAAESKDAGAKKDLVISIGKGMTEGSYDPCKGYGIYGYGIFHTGLLKITTDVKTDYDLASDYSISEDGLVYTYTIRDDVKFSDGERLTPEDVVFTYETAKNSGSSVDLTMLEKAEVADGNKVQFTLNKVYSPFIRTTALLGIVPEHAYDDEYADHPIGTGPFVVKQLDVNQQLIVEPNKYYYGTKSEFEQITFLSLDEETALANARSGELDLVMINPEYAEEEVEGMHLETIKTSDNRGFNLPCVKETANSEGLVAGNNVTSDIAVRKALNIGISRQEIIDNALNGIGTPSWVRFDGLPWANDEPELKDNQVQEAKKILEQAGWVDTDNDGIREKDGIKCEFTITGRTDDLQRYNLAVALSENAKKLGIHIIAKSEDWTTCKDMVRNSPTCIGTGDYNFVDVYNAFASEFAGAEQTGLNNAAMYTNKTVDGYLTQALASDNEEEIFDLLKKAQYDGTTGVNVDLPYLWLVNIDHTYLVKNGLDIGTQRIHPHGHGQPIIQNLNEWAYKQS